MARPEITPEITSQVTSSGKLTKGTLVNGPANKPTFEPVNDVTASVRQASWGEWVPFYDMSGKFVLGGIAGTLYLFKPATESDSASLQLTFTTWFGTFHPEWINWHIGFHMQENGPEFAKLLIAPLGPGEGCGTVSHSLPIAACQREIFSAKFISVPVIDPGSFYDQYSCT
jgi:hypothetical protein